MNQVNNERRIFKFNMSIYYQSIIIYFIVFVLYILIKGEFLANSFTLITKDPVIYFFILILFISLGALLYNLYLNRHIEITPTEIIFRKRTWERRIKISDIESIRITKERRELKSSAFRLVRMKIKNKRLPLTFRPYDYENKQKLMEALKEIKMNLNKNV